MHFKNYFGAIFKKDIPVNAFLQDLYIYLYINASEKFPAASRIDILILIISTQKTFCVHIEI